jgi:hypothetical protein
MASTTNAQGDPDPTTQVAWPSSKKTLANGEEEILSPVDAPRQVLNIPEPHVHFENRGNNAGAARVEPGKKRLTTWDFIIISVSMLGAQITWSVELGYVFTAGVSRKLWGTDDGSVTEHLSLSAWGFRRLPLVWSGWQALSVASSPSQ